MGEKTSLNSAHVVRLTAIEFKHFKNVEEGKFSLSSWKPGDRLASDIVGIYGQNGSGKTSAILTLSIIRKLLLGYKLPGFAVECTEVGRPFFSIGASDVIGEKKASRSGTSIEETALFSYTVEITTSDDAASVQRERLSCKPLTEPVTSSRTIFDYHIDNSVRGFSLRPKTLWRGMLSIDDSLETGLVVAQQMSLRDKKSFLFSNDLTLLLGNIDEMSPNGKPSESTLTKRAYDGPLNLFIPLRASVFPLWLFAFEDTVVVSTQRQIGLPVNQPRISTHEGGFGDLADMSFLIDTSKPYIAPREQLKTIESTAITASIVLEALISGLSLSVKRVEAALDENGDRAERIEFMVTRNDTAVPLRSESQGVKKLSDILIMPTDVYSKPSACIAIDELDSEVFEFLLGELLEVLREHGRGRLIFTAHNLRPLEMLERRTLIFTTTNPKHRCTTFKGTASANNLRSQCLRAINLGGQPETSYESTSKFEIDSCWLHERAISHIIQKRQMHTPAHWGGSPICFVRQQRQRVQALSETRDWRKRACTEKPVKSFNPPSKPERSKITVKKRSSIFFIQQRRINSNEYEQH